MSINPVSTYRIQFNKDFTFDDFEKIIPYLAQAWHKNDICFTGF